jgi:acetyltransferase-like isoleucine patch superfamily enzyme
MKNTNFLLEQFENLIANGLDNKAMVKAFALLGFDGYEEDDLASFKLWSDYLPIADQHPYTEEQRNLHVLWEAVDRSPLSINVDFAIPLRRMIAQKLFKKCGAGFIANEGCRFNYGHLIEVGDGVTWNHCCYIDSKGGVSFGDFSMITEYTKIFTHGHSESDHMERSYSPVKIGKYVKIYTACTVLPGVELGDGAVVATGSIVTKSVAEKTMVAGIPAKPVRDRKTEGKEMGEFNHYTLKDKAFQQEI